MDKRFETIDVGMLVEADVPEAVISLFVARFGNLPAPVAEVARVINEGPNRYIWLLFSDNLELTEKLLAAGVDMEIGNGLLMRFALFHHLSNHIVLFAKYGASAKCFQFDLHFAAVSLPPHMTEMMLEVHTFWKEELDDALRVAVQNRRDVRVIKALLKAGARDESALEEARRRDFSEIVELLTVDPASSAG